MKSAVIVALSGAAALAVAKPHGHGHLHRHQKREPDAVTVASSVSTALAFVLNGETIPQDQVCQGIADGSLKWDGDAPSGACAQASSIAVPTSTATTAPVPSSTSAAPASSSSKAAAQFYAQSSASSSAPASSSIVAKTSSAAAASTSAASSSSGIIGDITSFVSSLAKSSYPDFVEGVHKCSDGPPSEYGPIPVDYLNMGGWTSIQNLNSAQNDIVSAGTSCTDGASCSYACAAGWQKTQWVTSQPSDGASIGGLLCKGGYLYLANSNKQLCNSGTGGVTVQNTASGDIAVCRTDYPASESETIPMDVPAGSSQPLSCPDESTYYQHLGSPTSAQYYLNPIGVNAASGCSWDGMGDKQTGNWAPINFGVGYSNGVKWLSIMQNAPTSTAVFQGSVNITGGSSPCYYEVSADGKDGKYCGANGCQSISSGGDVGCTTSASGSAVFVVSA